MQKLLTSLAGTTVAAVLLAGCAQVPPNAGENPSDPYERVNRNIYAFNDSIDRALFRPVAETYVEWTPEWVRTRVSNVVDNLGDPGNAVNNTLQGKVDRGIESLMRRYLRCGRGNRPQAAQRGFWATFGGLGGGIRFLSGSSNFRALVNA